MKPRTRTRYAVRPEWYYSGEYVFFFKLKKDAARFLDKPEGTDFWDWLAKFNIDDLSVCAEGFEKAFDFLPPTDKPMRLKVDFS